MSLGSPQLQLRNPFILVLRSRVRTASRCSGDKVNTLLVPRTTLPIAKDSSTGHFTWL